MNNNSLADSHDFTICIIIAFLVLFESISKLLNICSIVEYVFQGNHCLNAQNN